MTDCVYDIDNKLEKMYNYIKGGNYMRVFIVDDNAAVINEIFDTVTKWGRMNVITVDVIRCNNFNYISDMRIRDTDVFFLNMGHYNEQSAIYCAKDIRIRSTKAYIVFIITNIEQMENILDYLIRPSGVICKPYDRDQIEKTKEILSYIKTDINRKTITVKIGHDDVKIPVNEILYIRYSNRKCFLKTHDQSYEIRETFSALTSRLGEDFIIIDKGTAVSIKKIESWDMVNRIVKVGCEHLYYARDRSKKIRVVMMENGIEPEDITS